MSSLHATSLPLTPALPSSAAGSSHQRRKAERPQELIAAALALFVEKGFASTKSEEVAQRAGVSKGTLYLYYPSKEELLKAVIRQYLSSEIAQGALQARAHQGSAGDALRGLMVDWWTRVFDSPASGVFKLLITEVRNFPEIAEFYQREVVEPGSRIIGELVERGIAAGEFRPVDVEGAVHSVVLPMIMLCLHKHSLGVCKPVASLLDARGFIAQHMDLLLSGMQMPGPCGPAPVAAPASAPASAPVSAGLQP
jgi:AcrR family transcriptional regulator